MLYNRLISIRGLGISRDGIIRLELWYSGMSLCVCVCVGGEVLGHAQRSIITAFTLPAHGYSMFPCSTDTCIPDYILSHRRSQWPRGLRLRSAAARLLRLWVRIPRGHGRLSCVLSVLSGRGLIDGLITRQEESYPLLCVVVCDTETS
jgi:hypothetical protein